MQCSRLDWLMIKIERLIHVRVSATVQTVVHQQIILHVDHHFGRTHYGGIKELFRILFLSLLLLI